MISVLIHAPKREPSLALTLSRLVESVVEGLARDAALVDLACDELAARLADAAGCGLFRPGPEGDPALRALDALRGDWIAIVPAGLVPERDWPRGLRDFLTLCSAGGETKGGAIFPASPLREPGLAGRLAVALGLRKPRAILLVQSATLRAMPEGPDFVKAAEKAMRGSGRAVVIRHCVSDAAG